MKNENDINNEDFDENEIIDILCKCNTYEEFRIQLDLKNIECIISKEEFPAVKEIWGYDYNDVSNWVM